MFISVLYYIAAIIIFNMYMMTNEIHVYMVTILFILGWVHNHTAAFLAT